MATVNNPASSPAPVAYPVWTCSANQLKLDGGEGEALNSPITVGQKFVLECQGAPVHLDATTLALHGLKDSKEAERALHILQVRRLSDSGAALVATTYVTGDVKPNGLVLSDGTATVALQGILLKVQSVIDPKENPERKAYDPFVPMAIAWPFWIWLVAAAFFAGLATFAAWPLIRRMKRRRFLRELAANPSPGEPYAVFNREMRLLHRRFPVVENKSWSPETTREFVLELEKNFRWFLARELLIPSLSGGPHLLLSELHRQDPELRRAQGSQIGRAIAELERALRLETRLTMTDGQQLAVLCRRVADQIAGEIARRGKR